MFRVCGVCMCVSDSCFTLSDIERYPGNRQLNLHERVLNVIEKKLTQVYDVYIFLYYAHAVKKKRKTREFYRCACRHKLPTKPVRCNNRDSNNY